MDDVNPSRSMVQCVSEPHITDEIYPRNEVESLSDQTGSTRDLGRETGWLLGQLDNDSCPFLVAEPCARISWQINVLHPVAFELQYTEGIRL